MVGGEITPILRELDETLLSNLTNIEGVIAFFVPSVENVGSQIQIRSISEKYDYIRSLGWELVIISEDDKDQLDLFKTKYELAYRLCSAKNTKIAKILELGGEIGKIRRTTILFNRDFQIIKKFSEVIPGSHHNHVINWIENNPQNRSSFESPSSGSELEEI